MELAFITNLRIFQITGFRFPGPRTFHIPPPLGPLCNTLLFYSFHSIFRGFYIAGLLGFLFLYYFVFRKTLQRACTLFCYCDYCNWQAGPCIKIFSSSSVACKDILSGYLLGKFNCLVLGKVNCFSITDSRSSYFSQPSCLCWGRGQRVQEPMENNFSGWLMEQIQSCVGIFSWHYKV